MTKYAGRQAGRQVGKEKYAVYTYTPYPVEDMRPSIVIAVYDFFPTQNIATLKKYIQPICSPAFDQKSLSYRVT
jgi:hypothetical protein